MSSDPEVQIIMDDLDLLIDFRNEVRKLLSDPVVDEWLYDYNYSRTAYKNLFTKELGPVFAPVCYERWDDFIKVVENGYDFGPIKIGWTNVALEAEMFFKDRIIQSQRDLIYLLQLPATMEFSTDDDT